MAHGTTTERMEMLLKQEAGASGVALGEAVARVVVRARSMCSFHIVFISSAEISVTTVAVIFQSKYAGRPFGFCSRARADMCGPCWCEASHACGSKDFTKPYPSRRQILS